MASSGTWWGPDQWIEQSTTARVDVDPRPEGVGPDDRWIEINTFEQTLAAYEGDRMVFATLVSTGRTGHLDPQWPDPHLGQAAHHADDQPGRDQRQPALVLP